MDNIDNKEPELKVDYERFYPVLDKFFDDKKDIKFLILMRKSYNDVYKPSDKTEWFLTQHLRLGMAIRNCLRQVSGDDEMGFLWDDYYMGVLNNYLNQKIREMKKESVNK